VRNIKDERVDTLRACRTHHTGKKYLDKETFYGLDQIRRAEAYLWLVWPDARGYRSIQRVCKLTGGGPLRELVRQNRVVRIETNIRHSRKKDATRSAWRFKPL
jgi:hypothetical protein